MVASTCFMNGTLTRLKKYNKPTQRMPAMKWNHRRMSWVASLPVMVGMTVDIAVTKWCMEFPPSIGSPTLNCRLLVCECPRGAAHSVNALGKRDCQAVINSEEAREPTAQSPVGR